MRKVSFIISFTTLMALSSAGCKTAPQLAWWKTADKSAVESSAVVRHAPELPSDIAMQAEGLAGSATKQVASEAPNFQSNPVVATSSAPAFQSAAVAATSSSAYPDTGAAAFSSTTAPMAKHPSMAASAVPSKQSNLGSIAMPYNPAAVPPAVKAATPSAVPAHAAADRYASSAVPSTHLSSGGGGMHSAPSGISAPPLPSNGLATTLDSPVAGNRYGSPASVALPTATTLPVTHSPGRGGDRYASASTLVSPPVSAGTMPSRAVENVVATASAPYRPAGTSSYPESGATQTPIAVANRPASPTSNATQNNTAQDNPAPESTTPGLVPQGYRYR